MFTYDLLLPWIALALVLLPLLYVQRWIHKHLFGIGYLTSREKHAATLFYYLFLLPGVFLHEFSHYMVAGIFGVHSTRFTFFPEAQEDGSLEMGFVELEEVKNPVYAAFIGIAPLITGMLAVVWISNTRLNLPAFFVSIQNASDLGQIGTAVQHLFSQADFLLWTYLLFAIANAMMPSAEDRRGWWVVLVAAGLFLAFMAIFGFANVVVGWLQGPIAQALYSLSAVFGTVLILDAIGAVVIWAVEKGLERATGHKVEYRPALAAGGAAGAKALPKPSNFHTVFDLNLPIPPAPGKATAKAPAKLAPGDRPATPKGLPASTSKVPAPITAGAAAKPAPKPTPFGTAPTGSKPASAPASKPVSGPPALRPSTAPTPGKSNLPAPSSAKPPAVANRPGGKGKDEDVVDAEVIDEDEPRYEDDEGTA